MSKIYFVSGHLDLTEEEFKEHYVPQLNAALSKGDSFILCDAKGADAKAHDYLTGKTKQVTVFHMLKEPRYQTVFPTKGGFTSDKERDCHATQHSTHDIAWVRKGREKSGTAKNIKRRKQKAAQV